MSFKRGPLYMNQETIINPHNKDRQNRNPNFGESPSKASVLIKLPTKTSMVSLPSLTISSRCSRPTYSLARGVSFHFRCFVPRQAVVIMAFQKKHPKGFQKSCLATMFLQRSEEVPHVRKIGGI